MAPAPAQTASLTGARSHARSLAGQAATPIPLPPADIDPARLTWAESIPPGGYTAITLARGTRIRIVDTGGGACAHLLLYRAGADWERLNIADTMKVPWQAYPGAGHPLLSDQGRLLATIVADSSGHHDLLCGPTAAGLRLLQLGAAKHGLTRRDLAPSLALFHGVRVDPVNGAIDHTGSAPAGAAVDLLLHLTVRLVLANSEHPLDPDPAPGPLTVFGWRAGEQLSTPHSDEPEYLRALFNTEAAWSAGSETAR